MDENNNFKLLSKLEKTTNYINNTLINYPNRERVLKDRIENTLWQVFSIYRIPTTNDYLRINFNDNDSFLKFANMLKDRSEFNFNTEIGSEDRILTLSTCYDENSKTVLHAKLIKREGK